jgi:threonine dehydratase
MTRVLTADDVDAASARLYGIVERTPLQLNERLSALTGAEVWVKREDLQPVRSYKLRGAYNRIAQLSDEERAAGVVCASAGNHGQGVAFACQRLGISGRIFVPLTTPRQKRDRMVAIGGEDVTLVVLGDTYDEAAAAATAYAKATGAVIVHAFDHPETIAGQGTVCAEVVEALGKAPDVLVLPVGGGGLLAGVVTWFAERHPQTRIVGVEPAGAASLTAALAAGGPVDLEKLDTFVDGAAVRKIGEVPYQVIAPAGVEVVIVAEGAICTEMLDMYQTDGIIAEPAGALATAALRSAVRVEPGQTVVAIVSGGNNDVSRYSEIVERSLVFEGRKHYFLVNFPQEPGALRRFLDEVLGPDDDITLFEYVKRSNRELGPALVGIELGDPAELPGLMERMAASPVTVEPIDPDGPFYRFLV